jgi:hypothetical protein
LLSASPRWKRRNDTAEEQLPAKNGETPKLPLKNGSEIDAFTAYLFWKALEELAKPDQLKALNALAEGGDAKVTMRIRAELMTQFPTWFDDDGVLEPDARNVIQNAVRDSAEGSVVVTPFLIETQEETELLKNIHQMFARVKAQGMKDWADALANKEEVSAANRELRRDTRRLAKKLKKEAESPDDPGYSRPR